MYRIGVKSSFSAAHRLVGHPGRCSSLHGHTWTVEACFIGAETGPDGLLIDFDEAKKGLDAVTAPLDHSCLNDNKPFDTLSPTAENVARFVFEGLHELVRGSEWQVELVSVTVWESATTRATYML